MKTEAVREIVLTMEMIINDESSLDLSAQGELWPVLPPCQEIYKMWLLLLKEYST